MSKKKLDLSLPSHVTALGIPFQVQVVDVIDDEGSVGETSGEHRIIKIGAGQDSRRRWTTLWHEHIHAVLDVNGVGAILPEGLEEVIVQSLEHAQEQFLLAHGDKLLAALAVQKQDVD